MDFESPDVEREFPGLYSSETIRKNNESDCECVGRGLNDGVKNLLQSVTTAMRNRLKVT